jgi:hypothetical protein
VATDTPSSSMPVYRASRSASTCTCTQRERDCERVRNSHTHTQTDTHATVSLHQHTCVYVYVLVCTSVPVSLSLCVSLSLSLCLCLPVGCHRPADQTRCGWHAIGARSQPCRYRGRPAASGGPPPAPPPPQSHPPVPAATTTPATVSRPPRRGARCAHTCHGVWVSGRTRERERETETRVGRKEAGGPRTWVRVSSFACVRMQIGQRPVLLVPAMCVREGRETHAGWQAARIGVAKGRVEDERVNGPRPPVSRPKRRRRVRLHCLQHLSLHTKVA